MIRRSKKKKGGLFLVGKCVFLSLSPTCRCRFLTSCTMCCCSVAAAGGNDGSSFPAGKTGSKIDAITPREESRAKEKGYLYPHTTTDSLFVWSQWDAAGFPPTITKRTFMAQRYRISFCSPRFHTLFFLPEFTDTLGKQRSSALILLCRLATTATEGREDRIALRFSCVKHLLLFPCSLLPRKEDSGAFLFPFLSLRMHR